MDHGAAAFWYEKAAAQGNASALNNLGILHEDGLVPGSHDGTGPDVAKAKELYARALTSLGHAHALNNLGYLCTVSDQHEEAARHFRAASDKGHAEATHNLATLHENGSGRSARLARGCGAVQGRRRRRGRERRSRRWLASKRWWRRRNPRLRTCESALADKTKETERLAKELGVAKAESARLKGTIAELRVGGGSGVGRVRVRVRVPPQRTEETFAAEANLRQVLVASIEPERVQRPVRGERRDPGGSGGERRWRFERRGRRR